MSLRRLGRDERGAVLIQVGVAMMALIGFSALAIDYGVLNVARAQAQNAADAGALAAATTLAFDNMIDPTKAGQTAQAVASGVAVWGKPAVIGEPEFCFDPFDESCPTLPGLPTPEPRSSFSATVSVQQDLPTYVAGVFGIHTQSVRAQATATVVPANVATCVWPLAIPDNWVSLHAAEESLPAPFSTLCATPSDDRCKPYSKYGVAEPTDLYVPPAFSSEDFTTTAYELSELQEPMAPTGLDPQIFVSVLGIDPSSGVWEPARRSAFAAVQIGTSNFADSLSSCNLQRLHIGDMIPLEPVPPAWSQVTDAAQALNGLDAGASWDIPTLRIRGSCAAAGACGGRSPRLVLIPMFDPEKYDQTRAGGECGVRPCIKIVNFIGMFIDSSSDADQLVGHMTTYPGRDIDTTKPFVGYRWAFLRTAVLTR